MPMPRMCMTSKDIAAYTGMSVVDARYLVMKFERDGKVKLGRKRNKLVDIKVFADWYASMFDREPYEVRCEVKEWLKCATVGL